MGKVSGWVTAVLVGIMVGGLISVAFIYTSSPEYQAQEKIEQAKTIERSAIHYVQDRRTGLCFAAKTHWRGLGMAHVPCTRKVKDLIK